MTQARHYSTIQIALHWAVAVLIAFQYLFNQPISQAWNAISRGQAQEFDPLILAHVAGGILILALVLWRLALRFKRGSAPLPDNEPIMLQWAARLTHWTLYGLLIAMAVSGIAAWFGQVGPAAQAHATMKMFLMALIVLHILAVIFHHLVLKNPILHRMRLGNK